MLTTLQEQILGMRTDLATLITQHESISQTQKEIGAVRQSMSRLVEEVSQLQSTFDIAQRRQIEELGRLEAGIKSVSQLMLWGFLILGVLLVGAMISSRWL